MTPQSATQDAVVIISAVMVLVLVASMLKAALRKENTTIKNPLLDANDLEVLDAALDSYAREKENHAEMESAEEAESLRGLAIKARGLHERLAQLARQPPRP